MFNFKYIEQKINRYSKKICHLWFKIKMLTFSFKIFKIYNYYEKSFSNLFILVIWNIFIKHGIFNIPYLIKTNTKKNLQSI